MRQSAEQVLSIRIVGISKRALERSALSVTSTTTAVILSAIGPVIALIAILTTTRAWNISLYYVLADAGLTFMLVQFPAETWRSLIAIASDIDAILPTQALRDEIGAWLQARLNLKLQAITSVLAGLAGAGVGLLFLNRLGLSVRTSFAFLVSTAIACGLGANSLWWLWSAPHLARRLAAVNDPQLDWVSPLDTAGIQLGRALSIKSAVRTLVGTLVLVSPFGLTSLVRPLSSPIFAIVLFATTISFATTGFIVIMPQYWLIKIVTNYKVSTRLRLRRDLPLTVHEAADRERDRALEIYHWVEQRPTASWDLKFLVTLAVAVVGTVAACAATIVALQ